MLKCRKDRQPRARSGSRRLSTGAGSTRQPPAIRTTLAADAVRCSMAMPMPPAGAAAVVLPVVGRVLLFHYRGFSIIPTP